MHEAWLCLPKIQLTMSTTLPFLRQFYPFPILWTMLQSRLTGIILSQRRRPWICAKWEADMMMPYLNVPKRRTRRCCVTDGSEVMSRWMWSRCSSVSWYWIMEKSCCSPSRPKIPSGSFRRNFLRTDAIVYTEKLSVGRRNNWYSNKTINSTF